MVSFPDPRVCSPSSAKHSISAGPWPDEGCPYSSFVRQAARTGCTVQRNAVIRDCQRERGKITHKYAADFTETNSPIPHINQKELKKKPNTHTTRFSLFDSSTERHVRHGHGSSHTSRSPSTHRSHFISKHFLVCLQY